MRIALFISFLRFRRLRMLVNTLVVARPITSILNCIQVMSKEERIYVHEKHSYGTHDKH